MRKSKTNWSFPLVMVQDSWRLSAYAQFYLTLKNYKFMKKLLKTGIIFSQMEHFRNRSSLMLKLRYALLVFTLCVFHQNGFAHLTAGVAQIDITPPIGSFWCMVMVHVAQTYLKTFTTGFSPGLLSWTMEARSSQSLRWIWGKFKRRTQRT